MTDSAAEQPSPSDDLSRMRLLALDLEMHVNADPGRPHMWANRVTVRELVRLVLEHTKERP